MRPIKTLEDRRTGKGILTPTLQRLYGGPLSFPNAPTDRPWTIVNFVTTLEGITSFNIPGQEGGGEISGFNEQDKFIMGLLRAAADAVMVGANTLRLEPDHLWTPSFISKEHAALFEALRKKLGKKRPSPLNMFVTGSGKVLPSRGGTDLPAVFRTADIEPWIITTDDGKQTVEQEFRGLAEPNVLTFGQGRTVDLRQMMRYLRQKLGVRLLLIEGGASFNGAIAEAELYDEIFLTRAPQVIGSPKDDPRPPFAKGFDRTPETALKHRLISVRVFGDHLFVRYRRKGR